MNNSKDLIANDAEQPAQFPRFIEFFLLDADLCIGKMEAFVMKNGKHDDGDVKAFTIAAHSMKNALAHVGENELSKYAERLEKAGWGGDMEVLRDAPDFIEKLKAVVIKLLPEEEVSDVTVTEKDYTDLKEMLLEIKQAIEEYDNKAAKEKINELRNKGWPERLKKLMGEMSEQLLSGNPKEAMYIADLIRDTCNNREQ